MRFQIKTLLRNEIEKGEINEERLLTKVAAFLEMINSKMNAFDSKTGERNRLTFEDAMQCNFKRGEEKIPLKIISPRFVNGQYVASRVEFGTNVGGKPFFKS